MSRRRVADDPPPRGELAPLTWPEAGDVAGRSTILAVPLGSTEQHGPHLPLSTDSDIARTLCDRLAGLRGDVLVAPVLPYGASGEHEGFPGTLSIGHDALESVLVELCRSATRDLGGVVLVSAHGGNAVAVARAERRLQREGRRVLAWLATWEGDAHAGRTETSLMLRIAPHAVRTGRAERGATAPLRDLMPALRDGALRALSPNGVLGDPAGASAEEGEDLLDRLATTLRGAVDSWTAAWRAVASVQP